MAIDQRDVSSTLRFMDDRALQQYAAMHKNDPYIFPLAFQESQNRQRLRMSQQGAQGMQPQPKVADQALAQMAPQQLPEDVGIGALPADNMQFAAEGGIMGYSDDNFAARSEPVVMMAEGGVARYQVGGSVAAKYQQESQEMVSGNRVQYSPDVAAYASQLANEERAAAQAGEQAFLKQEQQRMLRGPYGAPPAAQQPSPTDASFRRKPDPRMMGIAATAQPLITSDAAPAADTTTKVDTKRKDTGRKDTAAATDPSAKTETGGLDSLINSYTRSMDLGIGEGRNARVGLAAALEQTPKTRAERNAEERAKEGDVFAGREARLAEREKGIEGMGDKYLGLALLQAGAAMMSTPGNIGAALGKGIAVGSERYIAGIDKINAAKDKFAEARDRLEDLRQNRADMTKKEIREDQRAIDDGILQAKRLMVDGATNDLKISADAQTKIFGAVAENIQTDKRITSAEKIARMQVAAANRTPAEIQMVERIMAEKKIPFTEALNYLTTAKREPVSEEKLRGEWLDPAKNMMIMQQYPNVKTFEDYKTVMGMGGGAGGFKVVGVR